MDFRRSILLASTIVCCFEILSKTRVIAQIVPIGTTQIQQIGPQFNIQGGNLSSDGHNLFQNFQQFNLTKDQIANFESNPNIRNIFSQISGGESSFINGLLKISGGNANLYLMNPSGIFFGRDVRLDLPAAFNATTATEVHFGAEVLNLLKPANYVKLVGDPTHFKFTALQSGAIVNSGQLGVSHGQTLSLLGSSVVNTGSVSAPGGQITIAAIPGTNLVKLSHENNVMSLEFQPFDNQSLSSSALPQLLAGRNIQNAQAIELTPEGQVKLTGSGLTLPNQTGVAALTGTIETSSSKSGGNVTILGNQIALTHATINATGNTQGGTVLIGGDYQGQGSLPTATQTQVDQASTIDVSANLKGNAGKVVIWSDQSTSFGGLIRGEGGVNGGNGGWVEVSGKEALNFQGRVKLGATQGKTGSLLLDPTDIIITDQAAQPGFNFANFNALTGSASIAIGDLQILSEASNITLLASNSIQFGNPNNNLYLNGPNLLTLNAPTIKLGGFNVLNLKLIGNTIQTADLTNNTLTIEATTSVKTGEINAQTIQITTPTIETQNIQGNSITLNSSNQIKTNNITGDSLNLNAATVEVKNLTGDRLMINATNVLNAVQISAREINITAPNVEIQKDISRTTSGLSSVTIDATASNSQPGTIKIGGEIQSDVIDLTATNNIEIKKIITTANINGKVSLTTSQGEISTRDIDSPSNPITLTANAGNITTGLLRTTPITIENNAADITLLSGKNIQTGTIDADGFWSTDFLSGAGNITLKTLPNTQSSITTGGIRARSHNASGTVTIDSDQVTIGQGDSTPERPRNPAAETVNVWASGDVTITHAGGMNNQPLNLAASAPYEPNAIPNPQASSIDFTTKTEKRLKPNAPDLSNVTIVNRNQAPTIAPNLLSTNSLSPGEIRTFTLRSLGVTAQDLEKDQVEFFLRLNPNNLGGQLYLKATGQSLNQTRIAISLDDEVVYQAPTDRVIQGKVLDILASDLPLTIGPLQALDGPSIWSQALQKTPESIVTLTIPLIPQSLDPIINSPINSPINLPSNLPNNLPGNLTDNLLNNASNNLNNNPSSDLPSNNSSGDPNRNIRQPNAPSNDGDRLIRSSDPEKNFTQDFLQAFGGDRDRQNSNRNTSDAKSMMQQIGGITGIKPALIYLNFVPANARSNTPLLPQQQADDRLEITLITAQGIQHKRILSVQRSNILQTVQQFRKEITNPIRTHTTSYLSSAQQLYQWFIQPIEETLKKETISNLIFLPDEGLRAIPYAALHDGKGFLIEQFSVGLMPSLSLTDLTYRDLRNDRLLTLGISEATQDQTPLPNVMTELSAIQSIWPNSQQLQNKQATLPNFKSARTQTSFNILHLATHGNFAAGSSDRAYIQLWNDRLKLDQIPSLGWNQPPIELLVLSACKTAVGDRESELGFAGVAIQTGVKSTIASLWSVNDSATTALMSKFYESLKQSPIKAEALRQAQIALAQGKVKLHNNQILGLTSPGTFPMETSSGDSNFQHPYYWSAFTLVGNPW